MLDTLFVFAATSEHAPENDPILPHDLNELWWGLFAFIIIAGALWKFGYPPAKKALIDRREGIAADLAEAEAHRTEATAQLEEVRAQLSDADNERQRIVTTAHESAKALAADLDARAQTEVAEMKSRAQREIAASQQQAMADLQATVATLALDAAETVVRTSLDDGATQQALIDDYITQLGSN
jgi:F-type H+-transporting ATPase subunit b